MRASMYFKSLCITFGLLMFMACGGGGGGGSSSSKSRPNIALSETSYDFSGIVVNNTADHTFEIRNTGKANLTVGQISVAGTAYSIPSSADACSGSTLRTSGKCTFRARFAPPNQQQNFPGVISIPSNDPGGTKTIDLNGEGYGLNVWIKNAAGTAGCIVNVDVTLTDEDGNIVDDNGNIWDDNGNIIGNIALIPVDHFFFDVRGIAVDPNEVTYNGYDTPSPVSVVLAIDCSTSEKGVDPPGGVFNDIKNAAKSFIDQLHDDDEAAVCSFNSTIEFDPEPGPFYDLATNRGDLKDYIDNLSTGGGTLLYDAVHESIDRAFQGNAANKHIVVVLSDGVDSGSEKTLRQVIDNAKNKGVAVFTIYYRDPDFRTGDYGDPDILRQVADGADGQAYDGMTGTLDNVYYKIVSSIRNRFRFEIDLSPNCTPGEASLDVVVDTGTLNGKDSTTVDLIN